MIYHSMICEIHKGLWSHPRTLAFNLPLLFKLDSALSRENSIAAIANILLFFALRVLFVDLIKMTGRLRNDASV